QTNEATLVLLHDAFTHHMVRILLQPSLSPANPHQTAGCRMSAFLQKTLPESRIVVGFGNNRFPRIKGAMSLRGTGNCQVTYTYLTPYNLLRRLRRRVGYLYFQRH